jgi:two-component system sensor histidine kinase and response regulator WspE
MSGLGGFSMFDLFREEAETHAGALESGLLQLESDPADASVAIEPLMRAAHSIKGAARIIGLDIAVGLAHAMEDIFVAVQDGRETLTSGRVDQLLKGTDFLRSLSALDESAVEAWSVDHQSGIDALVTQLRADAPLDAAAPAPAPDPVPSPESAPVPAAAAVAASDATAPPAPEPASEASAVSESSSPPATASAGGPSSSAVRVDSSRLERMMQLAGEVMITSRRFAGVRQDAVQLDRRLDGLEDSVGTAVRGDGDPRRVLRDEVDAGRRAIAAMIDELDGLLRRTEEISADLYGQVLGSRMRPFEDGGQGFPRMVRDLAKSLGKQVRFEVRGGRTRVDREILASLEAPLTHLLRNAVDHGIETPSVREAAGKTATATLMLEARHHAGMLLVRVSEDGRGIDPDGLRQRIVERGLSEMSIVERLEGAELYDFLFLPGFSTAASVTEVSGRGVGLDVVQSMVHAVGGAVRVESVPGRGTTFELQLPVTRSVVRAAIVEVAGEPLALPLARLQRVVRVAADQVTTVEGRRQFEHEGGTVGLVRFATLLDLDGGDAGDRDDHRAGVESVVVVGDATGRCGLVVDRFLGEQDLVVRRLDDRFGRVPHVNAAAMLEDGSPILILDVEDVVKSIRQLLGEGRLRGTGRARTHDAGRRAKRVLVVEDSITVREVERQILRQMGLEVETAVDGVDGWNALQQGGYDLVVSDIDMPRMNGIEFVRTLRADERFRTVPVIVVSYKDRDSDRQAGLDAGADAYLTKGSFREGTFTETVRDLLGLDA